MRFDPVHVADRAMVSAILDAARRSPSAGNSQPWRFILGIRGDSTHQRLVEHLAHSSAVWAPDASLLVANLSVVRVAGSDLEYSEFARYDLGQAVAWMTMQAQEFGLAAHQFRAFDREEIAREFSVPDHLEVTSMTAFGPAAHRSDAVVGNGTTRDRLSLPDLLIGTPEWNA